MTTWTPERREAARQRALKQFSREEQRRKLREAWTPERRAAQALRAKSIPKEARQEGWNRVLEAQRSAEGRERARQRAVKQWSSQEARRRASEATLRRKVQPEWRERHLERLWAWAAEYWTPERREAHAAKFRKPKLGFGGRKEVQA